MLFWVRDEHEGRVHRFSRVFSVVCRPCGSPQEGADTLLRLAAGCTERDLYALLDATAANVPLGGGGASELHRLLSRCTEADMAAMRETIAQSVERLAPDEASWPHTETQCAPFLLDAA